MIADRLPQARILMVDDEAPNLDLLRRILETAGFTTVETVHRTDVENVIRLIYAAVKGLKAGQDMRYFK